jgi:hypothetical protein
LVFQSASQKAFQLEYLSESGLQQALKLVLESQKVSALESELLSRSE